MEACEQQRQKQAQQNACQSNWMVKHDASGEHLFLVTNHHVLRGGATVEIWFIPQYGNDYIHVSLPLVDGESKEPNWSTAAIGIHADVAVLPVTMLKGRPYDVCD